MYLNTVLHIEVLDTGKSKQVWLATISLAYIFFVAKFKLEYFHA